jgi:micrococcal nuclease
MAAGGYIGITGGGTGDAGVRVPGSGPFPHCSRANQQNCVIDGDTIRYGGVKVRLADIDAPEVFSPKCASEAALGQRATQRLVELMNAGPFELVRAGGRDEDIYGRKLRVIERGGRSVADTLVTEGLARRWDGARRSWCG